MSFRILTSFSRLYVPLRTAALMPTPTSKPLLAPPLPTLTLAAGMKWVAQPKKRCPHCYFEVIDEILYVFCPEKPRHRQGQMQKRTRFTAILTHATNCPKKRKEMHTQHSLRCDY